MNNTVARILFCLILALCLASPVCAAEIAQGKCVSYDKDKKVVTIEEYDLSVSKEHKYGKPTGKQAVIDMSEALYEFEPEPGHVLRIAYKVVGNDKKAIRIMNLTKQDLMKK
ncbi:MAG: hypothetical protein AB1646_02185 [Thermodesulfobacteriota bacterium]